MKHYWWQSWHLQTAWDPGGCFMSSPTCEVNHDFLRQGARWIGQIQILKENLRSMLLEPTTENFFSFLSCHVFFLKGKTWNEIRALLCLQPNTQLVGGWTTLKKMLVKLDHFPLWVATDPVVWQNPLIRIPIIEGGMTIPHIAKSNGEMPTWEIMGKYYNPYHPWDERYIYLHEWLIFMVNVGKYTIYHTWMEWVINDRCISYNHKITFNICVYI